MRPPLRHLAFALLSAVAARAALTLPAVFSDHMVLQRGAPVPVWGTTDAGATVTVEFAGQKKSATAAADGRWRVDLDALTASATPRELLVSANRNSAIENQKFSDVLVGEVWLGSGQSNMAFTVNRAQDFEKEKAAANFPLIRHFREESTYSTTPQTVGKGSWAACTPDTVGTFSAALYFFGRELHQTLGVPIGLINSSVGGTPIESWIAPDVQRAHRALAPFFTDLDHEAADLESPAAQKKYESDLAAWEAGKKTSAADKKAKKAAKRPADPAVAAKRKRDVGGLFLGKIVPLIPYALHGVLWYQGEANSTPAKVGFYREQLPLLIRDWRARWGAELPFAWVQLPNFNGPGRDWPLMREAFLQTLALPRTGQAIAIDVGLADNIHPTNKQAVGHRLALWALGDVYGEKVPDTSGPLPAGHEVRGKEIVLRFTHAVGLNAHGGELTGFELAGADQQWHPAQARIVGDTVIVSSPAVTAPVAARYAWANNPTCNLYNSAGLPASPFRTDAPKPVAP